MQKFMRSQGLVAHDQDARPRGKNASHLVIVRRARFSIPVHGMDCRGEDRRARSSGATNRGPRERVGRLAAYDGRVVLPRGVVASAPPPAHPCAL